MENELALWVQVWVTLIVVAVATPILVVVVAILLDRRAATFLGEIAEWLWDN